MRNKFSVWIFSSSYTVLYMNQNIYAEFKLIHTEGTKRKGPKTGMLQKLQDAQNRNQA